MALIVRLIDDIKTETVIKLITVRRIRVMAGPDRIDVVLFHYLQIFFDLCKSDCKSRHRIAVVAVCSVEFDLHAVQVQHTVLRVDLTDADMISDHLTRRLQHQRIQIRLLGIPQMCIFYMHLNRIAAKRCLCHKMIFCIKQLCRSFLRFPVIPGNRNRNFSILVRCVRRCLYKVIADAFFWSCKQIDIAENAAHAEFVLILEIASIAPFQHQYGDGVGAIF